MKSGERATISGRSPPRPAAEPERPAHHCALVGEAAGAPAAAAGHRASPTAELEALPKSVRIGCRDSSEPVPVGAAGRQSRAGRARVMPCSSSARGRARRGADTDSCSSAPRPCRRTSVPCGSPAAGRSRERAGCSLHPRGFGKPCRQDGLRSARARVREVGAAARAARRGCSGSFVDGEAGAERSQLRTRIRSAPLAKIRST
jgi:hypothetical protein